MSRNFKEKSLFGDSADWDQGKMIPAMTEAVKVSIQKIKSLSAIVRSKLFKKS